MFLVEEGESESMWGRFREICRLYKEKKHNGRKKGLLKWKFPSLSRSLSHPFFSLSLDKNKKSSEREKEALHAPNLSPNEPFSYKPLVYIYRVKS